MAILNASLQHDAAIIALVDAIAGIMFFTTPWVRDHVTPSILNSFARAEATPKSQPMCSGSSVSSFLSNPDRSRSQFIDDY